MNPFRIARIAGRRTIAWLTSPHLALLVGEPLFLLLGVRGRKKEEIDLCRVRRVLMLRPDEVGDVVLTTPLLRELRRLLPGAWITLVVKPAVYNLVEICPYVDEVLTYDWRITERLQQLRRHGRALRLAWRYLLPRRFDLALTSRWDTDYYHAAFLQYFSGARCRVGYSESVVAHKQRLNAGYDSLFSHVLTDSTLRHEVERNLELVRVLGGTVKEDRLELWLGREDEAYADGVFQKHPVAPGELIVGFSPSGGNSPLKQWPVNSFIELGLRIRTLYSGHILVVGGPGEEALGAEIERALGTSTINVVGKTTLRQMAALLKRCHLYVGNDAGPMHVAAAMGIPVVALFGSSCPHRFGPWGSGHRVLWPALPCSPCFHPDHLDRCGTCIFDRPHCIQGISVEQVDRAVEEIVQNRLNELQRVAQARG